MFDINNTLITLLEYKLSYVEFFGTLFGLLSVYWASRANIWTWPAGIVNEFFFLLLFFQVQLYANMLLQVIFFITTLYGWYSWRNPKNEGKIGRIKSQTIPLLVGTIVLGTVLLGFLNGRLHIYLPQYFTEAAAYAYADSAIFMISVIATLLLAKKRVESWVLWIVNNLICITLYIKQGVYFIAIEYVVFLGIASFGLYSWMQVYKRGQRRED